jgi:hypothetical protein
MAKFLFQMGQSWHVPEFISSNVCCKLRLAL